MTILKAKQTTFLKTSPKQSTELSFPDKIEYPEGSNLEVLEERLDPSGHKIFTLNLFAWSDHWEAEEPKVNSILDTNNFNIDVPFLSQRDNRYEPYKACLRTSYAMAFAYFDINPKLADGTQLEDKIYQDLIKQKKNVYLHSNFVEIASTYGITSRFTTTGNFEEIDAHLKKGLPCIISGNFTRSGHIILLRGVTDTHYYVNDPFGEVLGQSYKYANSSGENLKYSKDLIKWACEQTAGKGKVWVHFLSKENFSPKWTKQKVIEKPRNYVEDADKGIYFRMTSERRLFLDLIAWCEGTDKDLDYQQTGYNLHFGYSTFEDFSKHPKKVIRHSGYSSSAAGRYQIMDFTEDDLLTQYPKLRDFSPTYQDQRGLALIRRRGGLNAVDKLDLEGFLRACAKEWASLPFSPYGQPTKSLSSVREGFARLKLLYQL